MKTLRLPRLLAFLSLLSTSIGQVCAQQQVIETEPLGPFTTLQIDGPIRIQLVPADESRMQILLWGLDARALDWRNKDNTLFVSTRKGMVNKRAYANITLYYKELNRIVMSGGEVKSKEPIVCHSLYLEAESSTGKMDLMVECNDITIHVSGSNVVQVNGTAEDATYQARLGSRIEALGLSAMNVNATASGKAEIQVRANEILDAKATAGGNIFFSGEPVTLNIKKATMGGVSSVNEQ